MNQFIRTYAITLTVVAMLAALGVAYIIAPSEHGAMQSQRLILLSFVAMLVPFVALCETQMARDERERQRKATARRNAFMAQWGAR